MKSGRMWELTRYVASSICNTGMSQVGTGPATLTQGLRKWKVRVIAPGKQEKRKLWEIMGEGVLLSGENRCIMGDRGFVDLLHSSGPFSPSSNPHVKLHRLQDCGLADGTSCLFWGFFSSNSLKIWLSSMRDDNIYSTLYFF